MSTKDIHSTDASMLHDETMTLTSYLPMIIMQKLKEIRRLVKRHLAGVKNARRGSSVQAEVYVYSDGEDVEVIPYEKPPPEVITLD